jgi:hypothetical protein
VILRIVLSETGAHVAVDRVQALSDSTRAVDVRLLSDDDLLVLAPVAGLERGASAAQACTADQDVDVVFDDSLVSH